LKNCVKLPSPEAESDIPGDENPFIFAGAGAAACGEAGVGSNTVLAEYSGDGLQEAGLAGAGLAGAGLAGAGGTDPLTKMRVNSPGAGAGCDSGFEN
jgi:hypothetical protein